MADIRGVRSPLIINVTGALNDDVKIKIYIYRHGITVSNTPNYEVSKTILSTLSNTVSFDVADYCKKFMTPNLMDEGRVPVQRDLEQENDCSIIVAKYINDIYQDTERFHCTNGYTYFQEGANATIDRVYLDEGTYYVSDNGKAGGFGVIYESVGNNALLNPGIETWTVKYTSLLDTNDSIEETVYHPRAKFPYVETSFVGQGGNLVEVFKEGILQKTFTFIEVCETKYGLDYCDFINKYGDWQRLTFFGATRNNFSSTGDTYKSMPDSLDYDITKGTTQGFNINGSETVSLNTGWVPESYSEVMKQLLLSETVVLNGLPVNVVTKSIKLMTSLMDRNINYKVSFKYSFDTINNIQ